jgi:hypothetical protein
VSVSEGLGVWSGDEKGGRHTTSMQYYSFKHIQTHYHITLPYLSYIHVFYPTQPERKWQWTKLQSGFSRLSR